MPLRRRLAALTLCTLGAAAARAEPVALDDLLSALRAGAGSAERLDAAMEPLGFTPDFGAEQALGDAAWNDPQFWMVRASFYSASVTSGPPPLMVDCTTYGAVTWAAFQRGEVLATGDGGTFYALSDAPITTDQGVRLECALIFASTDPGIHPDPEAVAAALERGFADWTRRQIGDRQRFQAQREVGATGTERVHVAIGPNASGGPATDLIYIVDLPGPTG